MKETGNNMDCVACGKPISITAKFCGKCGAPVKRSEAPASQVPDEQPTLQAVQSQSTNETPTQEVVAHITATETVDDLVIQLDLPEVTDHASLLKIDLNLPTETKQKASSTVQHEATAVTLNLSEEPVTASTPSPSLDLWQAEQAEIKQMLEKQSHLLDFISLASQQQAHVQSQPSPLEPLLKEIITLQNSLSDKLEAVKQSVDRPQAEVTVRMPDEFKLMLEKQKIELLKAFSQNVAQNTANIEAVYKDTTAKIESLLEATAAAAQAMEKNMAPITQTVTDMKARLQTVSKKIDDVSTQSKKVASSVSSDSSEGSGGFILFIIGLLCGLTVVLSSLAIYNFLSHEVSSTSKAAHDQPNEDHGKPSGGHDEAAPSEHETANHDKPATDSSKSKNH